MEALWIAATDGGSEIEIDRCAECGALWFDAGELEMAANLHARPSEAESEHRCPVCAQQMRGASLPRGLFAHRCDSCQGTFLDASNIAALKSEKLPRLPETAARAQATVGFVCAECNGKFPYAQGNGTRKGLVCPGCVVNPQVDRITRGPTSMYRAPDEGLYGGTGGGGFEFDLVDLVQMVGDLFRR